MFVTEGEMEIAQKAQEKLFLAGRAGFFFLKYGMNRIYMWERGKLRTGRRDVFKEKKAFRRQDFLRTAF